MQDVKLCVYTVACTQIFLRTSRTWSRTAKADLTASEDAVFMCTLQGRNRLRATRCIVRAVMVPCDTLCSYHGTNYGCTMASRQHKSRSTSCVLHAHHLCPYAVLFAQTQEPSLATVPSALSLFPETCFHMRAKVRSMQMSHFVCLCA